MKIELNRILDVSDQDFINGYEVEEFFYPDYPDVSGRAELTIGDGDDTSFTINQRQEVNLNDEGYAEVLTTEGETISMRFKVVRTLTPADFS